MTDIQNVSQTRSTPPIDAKEVKTPGSRGRNYSGLTLEQRKAKRRSQFIEAGIELFGTLNFREATVRGICKQAKLTDRYFYESCGSLQKLFMDVYEHCMKTLVQKVLESIEQSSVQGSIFEAMLSGVSTYFKELEEPKVAQICLRGLEGISPETDQLYNRYIEDIAQIFVSLIEKSYPTWNISDAEKNVAGLSLVGILRQSATTWVINGYDKDRKTMISGTYKIIEGFLCMVEAESEL